MKLTFKLIPTLFVWLYTFMGYTQLKDSTIVNKLTDSSFKYVSSNYQKSFDLSTEALSLAESIKYTKGMYRAYNIKGIANYYKSDHLNSIKYYTKSKELASLLNDSTLIGKSLLNIGISYYMLGDFSNAIKSYSLGLKCLSEKKDTDFAVNTYHSIAHLYREMGMYDKAIEYMGLAINLSKTTEKHSFTASIILSLGEIYAEKGDYDKAIEYYKEAAPNIINSDREIVKGYLYKGIANYYLNKDSLSKAKLYLNKINSLLKSSKNLTSTEADVLNLQGDIAFKQQQYDSALKYYTSYLDKLMNIGVSTDIENAFLKLSNIYQIKGNYKKAYYYLLKHKKINDSILSNKNVQILATITSQYQSQKKDKEIADKKIKIQELIIKNIKTQRFWGITITVLSIIYLLYLIYKNKLLNKARKEVLEVSKAKSNLLNIITHELRTPLYSIIGGAYLLEQQDLNEITKKQINNIHFSANYLNSLVENALSLKKLNEGGSKKSIIKNNIEEVNVNHTVKNINYLNTSFDNKNVIEYNLDSSIPKTLTGPKTDLIRIITNLLDNANKFTKNGLIKITTIGYKNDDGSWSIRFGIEDNGRGINKDELDKIFDTFYIGKAHRDNSYIGVGLGLSIVKEILNLYGSTPVIESSLGKGTIVSFNLNFKSCKATQIEELDEGEIKPTNSTLKVLIAEDNVINQKITKKLVEKIGVECDIANNGQEACDLYKNNSYFLVLMDIFMPVMDGHEASKNIIEFDSKANIVALSCIEKVDFENNQQYNHYFKGFLPKPIKFDELEALVRKYL